MVYEGSIRRRLRELRERRATEKQGSSQEVDVYRVVALLTGAEEEIGDAKGRVKEKDFDRAHEHIRIAHEKLREASRLMGFRPRES